MFSPTSPFVRTIRESNHQGRAAWERFAAHRDRVTGILSNLEPSRSSLCILGAGNVNDVDLKALLALYSNIHLVDLDLQAVRAGLSRQGLASSKAVQVHGPLDLAGILGQLPTTVGADGDDEADVTALLGHLNDRHCAVPGQPFGVTLSAGVLTQLLQSVVDAALSPPNVVRVSLALRDKHLADLLRLTRPGGVAVLVTDLVSTTTAPTLLVADPSSLEDEMARLVAARNFFTGVNPYRIVALLEEAERYSSLVTDVRLLDPWLWSVTPDRQHLTCAILAHRSHLPADVDNSPVVG